MGLSRRSIIVTWTLIPPRPQHPSNPVRHVESGHCAGELKKVEKCNMEACPVCIDCIKVCKWGQWEHWDSCTKCGGQRKRTRQMHSHEVRHHDHHHDRRLEHIPTEVLCDPGAS